MAYDVWRVGGKSGTDTATKGSCEYRTSGSGTGKLLVSALTVIDTATFRGAQALTGALTVTGTVTLNGAVDLTDSAFRLGTVPVGNDTSAFGIGRVYSDTTGFLKYAQG